MTAFICWQRCSTCTSSPIAFWAWKSWSKIDENSTKLSYSPK